MTMLKKIANALAAFLIAQALVAPSGIAPSSFVMPAHAQFSSPSGGGTPQYPGNFIDPVYTMGADNTATATTGNITNGANSLTVASAASWSVGQGINVHNAASGGTAELGAAGTGCVSGIAGLVFTIVTCGTSTPLNASCGGACSAGLAVNHDNGYAAAQAALLCASTLRPIQWQGGFYYVSGVTSFAAACAMRGAGLSLTNFYNRGTTNDVFDIVGTSFNFATATWGDFAINQAPGITPTAGYAINLTGGVCATAASRIRMIMSNVQIEGTYGGLFIDEGTVESKFDHIFIYSTVGGRGLYFHVTTPCGDNSIMNSGVEGAPGTTDFEMYSADTMTIDNIKLNGGSKFFIVHEAFGLRFVNPSMEATGTTGVACGIDFGSGASDFQVTITGGEIAGYQSAFCNTQNNVGGAASNVQLYGNGGAGGGSGTTGNSTGNYQWPSPVVTGCTTNGTVNGDALTGNVTMTCTAQAMLMTFTTRNGAVPTNGQLCSLYHANGTLIPQTAYGVNNGPSYNSTATFGALTTVGSEVLAYKCQQF